MVTKEELKNALINLGIEKGMKGLIDLHDLFEKTRKANVLSHNNIMLSMAVCKGLNVIKYITMERPMPFCSILASFIKFIISI